MLQENEKKGRNRQKEQGKETEIKKQNLRKSKKNLKRITKKKGDKG